MRERRGHRGPGEREEGPQGARWERKRGGPGVMERGASGVRVREKRGRHRVGADSW